MSRKPRFAKLGRPLCLVVLALMLLSATAPRVVASPDKDWVTPNTANASSYEERDENSDPVLIDDFENISGWSGDGGQSSEYKEEGTYSYHIGANDGVDFPSYANKTEPIDTTGRANLRFWYKFITGGYSICAFGVQLSTDAEFTSPITLWSKGGSSIDETKIKLINLLNYQGTYYLRFYAIGPDTTGTYTDVWIDTLMLQGYVTVNTPSETNDEDIATKWRPDPANEEGAWCRWDLGGLKITAGCKIYWGADAAYRPTAYRIETTKNKYEWTTVVTETEAPPASAWKEYYWSDIGTQYVRLVVDTHGTSGTEIYEVQVYQESTTNNAPTISITVDNPLIDRKQDYLGSEVELDATITINIEDIDGYEDISSIRFWVRDAHDFVFVDNIQVIDDTIVIDDNTLEFTYIYNPPDALPDDNLGSFDVNVVVEDSWGASDSNDWGGDGAALFTVDDLVVPPTITPENIDMGVVIGDNITVGDTILRVSGDTASPDNVWVKDEAEFPTFTVANIDGDNYSKEYAVNSYPGSHVDVWVRVLDNVLDGENSASYTVTENQRYEIEVRWEDNYGLLPDENAENFVVSFYTTAGTQKETLTKNCEEFVTNKVVETIMLSLDGYNRTQIASVYGGTVQFFAVVDEATVKAYNFTLSDLVGGYGPPNGILYVDKWIGDEFAQISGDYWSPDLSCGVYLVLGDKYQFCVSAPDLAERFVGDMVMTTVTDRVIQVSPVAEGLNLIYTQVAWAAWRLDNNSVRMEYQDNLENTTIVGVKIYDMDSNLVGQTQPDNAWFIWTWPEADASESYNVVLEASHEIYGDFTFSTPVGLAYKPPGPGPGGITELFGMPIVFAAFASIILMISMGLVFDAPRAHLAAIAMALVLAVTWYMGWLPLPGGIYTVMLVLVMAVLFALVKGRRKR